MIGTKYRKIFPVCQGAEKKLYFEGMLISVGGNRNRVYKLNPTLHP
jgi:hypothetical protein